MKLIFKHAIALGSLWIMPISAGAQGIDIAATQGTQLAASYDDTVNDYTGDYNTGRANSFLIEYGSYYSTDALLGFDLQPILNQVGASDILTINSVTLTLTREAGDSGQGNPLWVRTSQSNEADNWNEYVITFDDYYAANPYSSLTTVGTATTPSYSDAPSVMPVNLGLLDPNTMNDGYLSLLVMAGDWTFTTPTYLYGMDSQYSPYISVDYTITNVPEPETYALMLVGLGLVSRMSRRRNRQEATH